MRRSAIVAAAMTVVIGLVGASLAIAAQRSGIVEQQTMSFAVAEGHAEAADVGPAGDSAGDTFFGQSKLMNVALTKQFDATTRPVSSRTSCRGGTTARATVLLPNGTAGQRVCRSDPPCTVPACHKHVSRHRHVLVMLFARFRAVPPLVGAGSASNRPADRAQHRTAAFLG